MCVINFRAVSSGLFSTNVCLSHEFNVGGKKEKMAVTIEVVMLIFKWLHSSLR